MDDWRIAATGVVAQVRRQDLDESGRNPRFKLYLTLRPTVPPVAEAPDANLAPELTFGIRETELRRLSMRAPREGELWHFGGRASGQRPAHIILTSLSPAEDDDPSARA